MDNYFSFNREAFNFIPVNYTGPDPMSVETRTLERICNLIGLNPAFPPATETRMRITTIAARIFCADWKFGGVDYPFSASGLVRVTTYIDAMPKPQGYAYLTALRRDAELLIPEPVRDEFDVGELLQAFRIWRYNSPHICCPLLLVGLFLLLFQHICKVTDGKAIRWDQLVDSIVFEPDERLIPCVETIVRGGDNTNIPSLYERMIATAGVSHGNLM